LSCLPCSDLRYPTSSAEGISSASAVTFYRPSWSVKIAGASLFYRVATGGDVQDQPVTMQPGEGLRLLRNESR
jgi:hypothetical protein